MAEKDKNNFVVNDKTYVKKPEIHYSYKFQPYIKDLSGSPGKNITQEDRNKRLRSENNVNAVRNVVKGLNNTFGKAVSGAAAFYGGGWALNRLLHLNKPSTLGQFFGRYVLPANTADNVSDGVELIFDPSIEGAVDLGSGVVLGRFKDLSKPIRLVGELIGQGANINNMKNGGQIRKMQTAAGGPINYKRWDNAKITSYTIPFIKEKAIKLTNAGRATGAILSTNVLDTLADNAMRAGVPVRTAIGISTKETTLGNPTDTKSAWNLSSGIRREFNGKYPGTYLHINPGRDLNERELVINYHKGHLSDTDTLGKSVIQEALEFYKQHPDKYNTNQSDYLNLVNIIGEEVMKSPEVLKWYREWEKSKAKIFRPEPYKINTNIQNTALEFIPLKKQGGQVRKMQTAAGGPIKKPIKRLKDGYRYIPDEENGGWDRISDNSMSDVFATMEFTPKKTTVGSSITRKQSSPSKTYYSAYNPDDVVKGFNALTLGGLNNLSPTQWARRIYDTGKLLNGDMTWSGYTNSWINGNNGLVFLKFSEEHPYLSAGINLVGDAAALGGITGIKKLTNISKPNVNVAADIGTSVEQKMPALSLEEIEKAFNQARQWHLNRINSPGYKDRALRAGFTEEEIPSLLQLLTRLINSLKLQNKEKLFPNNFSYEDNFGKINAEYWRLPTNKGMFLGIGFYNPNMSYDEAVSKFIHEFGHGATFGLNGNETTGLSGKLSKQFPLITKAVLYNKSLFPEVTEETVKKVFPYAAENGKLEYYSRPTELLARGYEFMRDYANNWWKLKNSGNSFTNLDVINNAANSRLNSKLFRGLTGNSGAYNFQKNALGISIPLGLGYSLYNNDNLLQLQYLKQGGKMDIIKLFKEGGKVRKMLTASGGPIKLYDTLWTDNWRNRLTSPVVVAKQLTELTNKIPIKYLGGSKDNARKEFWKQEPVLQHAVDSVASLYGINPESLKYRLDKEGFTDRLIKRVNTSVKQGTQRVHGRGYELLNDPNLGLAGTQIGLDDARTYIDSGKVKLINENWYEQGPFKNEKGRMTYPVNPVTLNDGIGIVAAHLKYFKDKALLDFPNASEYDLNRYANAYYNRGAYGGKKWVKAGAKGYNYRKKGGMLEFLKKGSGIHIKEKNKGKFTSYCGGKVTDECILKGKNSSSPAIRKRATFAANARKWKHKEGGIIKAADGTKTNWWSKIGEGINKGVNSKAGLYIAQGLLLGLGSIFGGNNSSNISNAAKGYMEMQELWLDENELRRLNSLLNSNIDPENPNAVEGVPKQVLYGKIYDIEQRNLKRKLKLEQEEMESLLNTLKSNLYLDIFSTALGVISNNNSNKTTKNNTSQLNGNPSKTTITLTNNNILKTGYEPYKSGYVDLFGNISTSMGFKFDKNFNVVPFDKSFNYQPLKLNV